MPDKDRDEDCYEHDDDDADRRCAPAAAPAALVYNYRAISHTDSCSFFASQTPRGICSGPVIPSAGSLYACRIDRQPVNFWIVVGFALSLITCVLSARGASAGSASSYASGEYGMSRATHSRYALVSFALMVLFAVSYFYAAIPAVPLLAVAVLISIFYFTSFLRGFADQD